MKNKCVLRRGISVICFLVGCAVTIQAQENVWDSVYHVTSPKCITDNTHRLKLKEVLIPAALVGVSALYVRNDCLEKQRMEVQDALSAKGKSKFKADDYIQYAPMVAVYGLNLFDVKGKHSFKDRTLILAMSYAIMGVTVHSMKLSFKEKRPDTDRRNSFPSGHTATAFMGAQFLYEEYKDVSPWIGYAGYAVAATTGYLRIYNNRHYINDVVAGACIGILSTKLAYWLYPKCFKHSKCNKGLTMMGIPYYSAEETGLSVSIQF